MPGGRLGESMSEIAAVAGLVVGTGGFIMIGVRLGTHYIDRALTLKAESGEQKPLVRPTHPSGSNWQSDAA
jgi:hypothetical protein